MCLMNGLMRAAAVAATKTTTTTNRATIKRITIAESATSIVLSTLPTMFLLLTMLPTLTTTTIATTTTPTTTMGTTATITINTKTTIGTRISVNGELQQQQQYLHQNYHQHQQEEQQQQPLLHAKTLALVERPTALAASATTLVDSAHGDDNDDDVRYASVSRKNNYIYNSYNNYHNNNEDNNHYKNNNDNNHYNDGDNNSDDDGTVFNTVDGEHDPDSSSSSSSSSFSTPPPTPVFDFGMPRNITARSGQTAAINCRVEHLGDKSVSWIRKRDLHILTAGILTYTSDERFKVLRTDDSKDWSLHVRYAQPRDSGIYECQVNTEPKISMAFRLNVIVTPPDAKAIISGPSDLYVKVGSAITLNCLVRQPSSRDIGPIHWYRGAYMITPFVVVVHPNDAAIDLSRRISMESQLGDVLKSRLRLANAQKEDSGNYTCMPTTAEAASVMVHVINDENPAAMQKSAAAPTTAIATTTITTTTTIRWLQMLLGPRVAEAPLVPRHRVSASFVQIICLMHIFQIIHNLLCKRSQQTR